MGPHATEPPEPPSDASERCVTEYGAYSSPPCFMHELDPSFLGLAADRDLAASDLPQGAETDWPTIRQWRKEMRAQLIDRRLRISSQDRAAWSAHLGAALETLLAASSGALIGCYWPFRGEFDARPVLTSLRDRGARLALPVVVEKGQPLAFRAWTADTQLIRGVWGIPIPADGEAVRPDILIAPLVGFDPAGYRLGYGGGFYDRTITAQPAKPLTIGVGFALARLATIHPQPHDIPMDAIVTEDGVQQRPGSDLGGLLDRTGP
jgi:5-formyltetrahydrofolate cyclo-ligase